MSEANRGLVIAGLGIPAVGKSSVLRVAAERSGWDFWAEPEETDWPAAVRLQSTVGIFTALSWFRSVRVPHLYLARMAAEQGRIAVVDSYYDVLMARYIDAANMSWLIPRDDPYFAITREMARVDNVCLPKADVVIFFRVSMPTWTQLIASRNRSLDESVVFPSAYAFQEPLYRAVCEEAAACKTRVLTFEPTFASVEQAALKLIELISPYLPPRVEGDVL